MIDMGKTVTAGFVRSVLLRQGLVGVVAFSVVVLLTPWALMLESRGLAQLWATSLQVGLFCIVVTALLSLQRLRESRAVFQALALEPETVEADDIGSLADLPFALTARFVIVGTVSAALMLVPPIRAEQLDDARAVSLALLTLTIIVSAAVVHYAVVRTATTRAVELSPLEPIAAWLEYDSVRLGPRKRVVRNVLLAIVAPVGLVGVGSVLVAHAHLRASVEQRRGEIAAQLARAALDPPEPGLPAPGSDDAIAAAVAHGFHLQSRSGVLPKNALPTRMPSGQVQLRTAIEPLRRDAEQRHALVRYSADLAPEIMTTGALLALLAVLLAALLGWLFGRALLADMVLASRQVSMLGTESGLLAEPREVGLARFRPVAELGSSVERLADRFRVFAAAQERAIEAKASAQRMKQLLFASVSHDLKSPLSAILGLVELVREEPLTTTQQESLNMVSSRGRELLALIETILDAARVEEGQLELHPQPVDTRKLIRAAIDKAFDLCGDSRIEVITQVAADMPPLIADPQHAARAVAVLIAHAMKTAAVAPNRAIRIRGTRPATGEGIRAADIAMARVHIEYVATSKRPSLLEMQLAGKSPMSSDRGMVLQLSLARSIVELHGGRVEVERGTHGAAVVTCWWPAAYAPARDER